MVTELLIDDLEQVTRAWAPAQKNYRARFEAGGMESVRKIIVGLGSLSRLDGGLWLWELSAAEIPAADAALDQLGLLVK